MGFYPFTNIARGFVTERGEYWYQVFRFMFPYIPKTWFHIIIGNRLVVFVPKTEETFGNNFGEECLEKGYYEILAPLEIKELQKDVQHQLEELAYMCKEKVRLVLLIGYLCTIDMSYGLTNAMPIT